MTGNPREFVRKWLIKEQITVDASGILCCAKNRTNAEIIDTIILDYNEQVNDFNYNSKSKLKLASDGHIQKALDELISLHVLDERKKLCEKIKFSGIEDLSLLEKFALALTGKTDPTTIGVLAHFLWSIKRRLMGLETVFQIMPIILGKQEAGKSYSVDKLLDPIKTLKLEMPLNEVIDPRNQLAFSRKFAIVINEMAGAQKTDVEKLKNLITTKNNDVRKLHTNTVIKAQQNTSLIGTTNKPVAEIINDPTGMRRFFEIRSLDLLDWPVIQTLDYISLWKGINETRERGYYEEHRAGIQENQARLKGIDEIQIFLDLVNLKPGKQELSSDVLYDAYKRWCENNGVKNPLNSAWFGRRLTGKGFTPAHQRRAGGKNTRFYLVNEDCEFSFKPAYDPLAAKEFL
jgi:hypothetical protein